jgi:FixJ family two-component response regulator
VANKLLPEGTDLSAKEIFILDDDEIVRDMLCFVLTEAGYDPVCFADGDALLATARKRYPVCILLDLCLPGKSGLDILHQLQKERYLSPVVLISGRGSVQTALQAGRMGALDFIEKPFKGSELIKRIAKVIKGEADAKDHLQRPETKLRALPGIQPFTIREQQIVDEILMGKSSKEIAAILKLSPRTVEDHRSNICKKANVKNTTQLIAILAVGRRATDFENPGHFQT